jgi:hypothetical protein
VELNGQTSIESVVIAELAGAAGPRSQSVKRRELMVKLSAGALHYLARMALGNSGMVGSFQ